jgi:hypothetical protein
LAGTAIAPFADGLGAPAAAALKSASAVPITGAQR